MKKCFILFLCLLFLSCSENQQTKFTIKQYDVEATFDISNKQLSIKAILTLNLISNCDSKINLLFNENIKISNIRFIKDNRVYPSTYKFNKDFFVLDIPDKIRNENNFKLYINYNYSLLSYTDSTNNKIKDTIFSLSRFNRWVPYQEEDIDFSIYNIKIRTPKSYEAITTGELVNVRSDKENTYFSWQDYNIPGHVLIIAPINYYYLTKKIIDSKTVNFYFINRDSTIKKTIVDEFCSSFGYFNSLLGNYGYEQLNFYEINYKNYGVELALALLKSVIVNSRKIEESFKYKKKDKAFNHQNEDSVYSSSYDMFEKRRSNIKFPHDTFNQKDDNVMGGLYWVAHELAHQWIGGGIFFDMNSSNFKFLSEGLAEYIRYMYIENKYGNDSLKALLKIAKKELEMFISTPMNDIPLSRNSTTNGIYYIKGPLVFNWIRKQIGDKNWKKFLRKIYKKYYWEKLNYNIFKNELSKFDKTGFVIKRMEDFVETTGLMPNECYY